MPVLITGATGMVGRALAKRLVREGGQVRAYVRREDADLRALGVHLAIGAIDDVPRLESALTRVHTIVHLVGGLWPPPHGDLDSLNRDSTEAAVIAATAAEVPRFIFLSFPGADPASPNEFLAAKGRAEEHVRGGGFEHAIFRPVPTIEWFARTFEMLQLGRAVSVPAPGTQRFNPLVLDDLVDTLVAADARDGEVRGTWELGGPAIMTLDDVARLAIPRSTPSHMRLLSPAPKVAREVLARETICDPSAAAAQFGLQMRAPQ
jgi:NADH dehydrogenase